MRSKRYILSALEKEAGGADLDTEANGLSIEHLFPQAADAGWEAFSERDQDTFVHRLGNLALLETTLNRDLANAPYADKRVALAASSAIITTRQVTETYDAWTPETLATRQGPDGTTSHRDLADRAVVLSLYYFGTIKYSPSTSFTRWIP